MVWFLVRIFFLYKFHSLFFSFEILVSWVVELFEKVLAFSLKLDLLFPIRHLLKRLFFVFLRKKSKFFLEIVIFSWVVELLEKVLAFSLKLDLGGLFRKYLSILCKTIFGVFPPVTCWRVIVLCVFFKKKSL